MEWTDMDPHIGTIIEVGCLVTDKNLNLLAEGPELVIHHSQQALDKMSDWHQINFKQTGLIQAALDSTTSLDQAETQLLKFTQQYCESKTSPLCGNSVHMDRMFLAHHMPNLLDSFSHRIIDVSTIKELYKYWYPSLPEYEKEKAHRALDDIKESVAELKYYRDKIFLP